MAHTARVLSSLIISIVLLITGNAYLMSLLGLRLSLEAFSPGLIGWILVFYSVGFVLGTLYAGRIIEKVGHIRAFAVFAAVLAASILMYPLAVDAALWGLLRIVGGFAMAGLMIVMESWFSSEATNENRARLFAVYQVVFFLSTAGGQLLIGVADPLDFVPFSLAAILVTLALVPLSLTRRQNPPIEHGRRMSLPALYRASRVGMLGALIAGLLISAFYTMAPVYANRIGLDVDQVALFLATTIVAAMLLAWPVGRVCDNFNRYHVMLGVSLIAAASSLLTAALGQLGITLLVVLVGLYMGVSAALYPIAVAITNDRMESTEITAASTALLLSYGIGSIIGPIFSALCMQLLGPAGLFFGNTAVLGLWALWMVLSTRRKPAPTPEEQTDYHAHLPEMDLGMASLDPRNTEFEPDVHTDDEPRGGRSDAGSSR